MIFATHPARWEVTRYRCECIRAALDRDHARLDWLQRHPPQPTTIPTGQPERCPF